ncbi:DUF2306 domain-containing protein [Kangiella sediminilitoris]|uniref:DUF2306 domain-containing protein n=1 Tax=Kangiella sediminilitoris TaxID=1144748 RepID=A0A1B3B7L1_9GAMM|nr:DUF2306 domain-containing protein [Kangiella sediminilitoris]AOE48776.1 hypothetical protein KS2013_44 [Kangiella sediminilitoris]
MQLINKVLLYLLAIGVAGYAVYVYGFLPLGSLVHPEMRANFEVQPIGIYSHIFASAVALTLGPFQFSTMIRQRYTKLHRWVGRAYLAIGVLVGGLSGLYMAFFAYGGIIPKVGFATLAVIWLYTGLKAYIAIRRGNIGEHRKWMIRNFSLTFAAVMLRIYLPLSMIAGIEFTLAYAVIAWICWVPNLVLAEWRINIRNNHSFNTEVQEQRAG